LNEREGLIRCRGIRRAVVAMHASLLQVRRSVGSGCAGLLGGSALAAATGSAFQNGGEPCMASCSIGPVQPPAEVFAMLSIGSGRKVVPGGGGGGGTGPSGTHRGFATD